MPNRYPTYGASNWGVPNAQQVQPGFGDPGYGVLKSAPAFFGQQGSISLSDLISKMLSKEIDPGYASVLGQVLDQQQRQQHHDDRMALNREALEAQQLTPFQQGVQTFGNVMQGVGSLANIYMGLSNMRDQKKNNALQREVLNTNLNNSITDYNRRLEERIRGLASYNGKGEDYIQSELARHSARRG